jgi:HPt (histidine-containing phosphotransfer) domain-containing protein
LKTPIIALTADALKGTREQCLAAGMDDYMTKPLDSAQVVAAIRKWTAGGPASGRAVRAADGSGSGGIPANADPPLVYEELLERCMHKPELAVRILAKFEKQAAADIAALAEGVAKGDARAVGELAHRLKGASANVAAPRLRMLAERLEKMAAQDQLDEGAALAGHLRQELSALQAHLDRSSLRAPAVSCA